MIDEIILVVPEADIDFCRRQIVAPLTLNRGIRLVAGGETRQMSVFNGLTALRNDRGIVVIHDGVRPFVRPEQFATGIEAAEKYGASILAVPAGDTLKRVKKDKMVVDTVEREFIWQAQTPQTFHLELITSAHEFAIEKGIAGSDDALLAEKAGHPGQGDQGKQIQYQDHYPRGYVDGRSRSG